MYTDDKNVQIILALLKEYGIKKIVVSPGMKNVPVALSVQSDPFFEVYSVVDERGASYFATGLSFESGEPVVITCTGATSSRNYLPGLTEAFYRKLPVIAITCGHQHAYPYTLTPQQLDRSVSQNDIKLFSAFLPVIHDELDYKQSVFLVNKALTTASINGGGPVHINVLTDDSHVFSTSEIQKAEKLHYLGNEDLLDGGFESVSKRLSEKKVGVFIGSHNKFNPELTNALTDFINKYNAVVFCDHTSGYQGINRIQLNSRHAVKIKEKPDVVIDMGGISGAYANDILFSKTEIWRISEDGAFIYRNFLGQLTHIFNCSERFFFAGIAEANNKKSDHRYFETVNDQIGETAVPDIPLSNTLISSRLADLLPPGASLHVSILNSLRNMNMFKLDASIDCSCNVGGFGIDGAVSTLIGQSVVNKNRIYFGLIGDLAFFYDMNGLGIRHIEKNVRLLVVNNGLGVEFRLNPNIEPYFKEDIDPFTAARGHFGSARGWAESMGFHYMTASTKEEFLSMIGDFCDAGLNHFGKPVLFEVFTTVEDEQKGLHMLIDANLDAGGKIFNLAKKTAKKALPHSVTDKLKKAIKR